MLVIARGHADVNGDVASDPTPAVEGSCVVAEWRLRQAVGMAAVLTGEPSDETGCARLFLGNLVRDEFGNRLRGRVIVAKKLGQALLLLNGNLWRCDEVILITKVDRVGILNPPGLALRHHILIVEHLAVRSGSPVL